MNHRDDNQETSTVISKRVVAATIAVVLSGWLLWTLVHSPVELGEEEYQITVALYRICNQQDQSGLAKISALVEQQAEQTTTDRSQIEALQSVVLQARAGSWQQAMQACRDLLDEQVVR